MSAGDNIAPRIGESIGSADGKSAARLENVVEETSQDNIPQDEVRPRKSLAGTASERPITFLDSGAAYGRIAGALIGLTSIFIAWIVTTGSATVFGYTSTQTASASLVKLLGDGTTEGITLGGALFILGSLFAFISYYGWIGQMVGLFAFALSVPESTNMNMGIGTVSATASMGIGVGVAALAAVIGAACLAWKWMDHAKWPGVVEWS